jgi:hypothetical protein
MPFFVSLSVCVESSEEKKDRMRKNGQDDDTVFPFLCLPKGGHAQIDMKPMPAQQNLLLMGGRKYTYNDIYGKGNQFVSKTGNRSRLWNEKILCCHCAEV